MANALRGGYDFVGDGHGRFWLNGTLFGMDISARSEERIRIGLHSLASLIDVTPDDASDVDREALLALADDLDTGAPCHECPAFAECGGTEGTMDFGGIEYMCGRVTARRIREALGVE